MKIVQGQVCELAVDDAGSGAKTPLILVHSLGGNIAHWDDLARHLRTERRVIRYDIRGHGRSGMPRDNDFTIEAHASDIGTVADAMGLTQFILMGHSSSAAAVYVYAANHPDRVTAYIALDAILDHGAHPQAVRDFADQLLTDMYRELLPAFWGQMAGAKLDFRNRLLVDVNAVPKDAIARTFRALLDFDGKMYAGKFSGPALAIVTPSNNTEYSLHNLPPGFSHTVVHDTGHWIQLEKPDEVKWLVDEFLKYAG